MQAATFKQAEKYLKNLKIVLSHPIVQQNLLLKFSSSE
jgi:hypothetical protein